ncbi:ATP-binding protein [Myxococcus xanthus]|uniref:ATP-binding protein n=1 Tax=Myxococcus xanthus TaxID=34 RepID=UPI001127EB61|nr:ATP-binding protein [Myxococcus xanthus]
MANTVRFQVDPRLATLLGENYRSTEQALKELIDNAWDADAEVVRVTMPDEAITAGPIVVADDGLGMTHREVGSEYLLVAQDRRSQRGNESPRFGRKVKGRKGIGKFAGLMVADTMVVETRSRGDYTRLEIQKGDLNTKRHLEKVELPSTTKTCNATEHGTKVTLTNLNQRLSAPSTEKLRQLLAAEYARAPGFKIFINDTPVNITSIPGKPFERTFNTPDIGTIALNLRIASGDKPTKIKNPGISIRVGGKIVGRPTFCGLDSDPTIPRKLLNRVFGEVEADGLLGDTTPDFGDFFENSRAYAQVQNIIQGALKERLQKEFAREINLLKARNAKEIKKALERLPEHRKKAAHEAIERILTKFFGESEERITSIISVALEALERDEYWVVLNSIQKAKLGDVAGFADALVDFGITDMAFMAQQARGRLAVLRELTELMLDSATEEKQMHVIIEKNLWILGPTYALYASNKTLSSILESFIDRAALTDRWNKRPDLLICNTIDEKHLLIELKRPSHSLTRDDQSQAEKYRDTLIAHFTPLEILVIGGKTSPQMNTNYMPTDLKVASYAQVVARAEAQLKWLVTQITDDKG